MDMNTRLLIRYIFTSKDNFGRIKAEESGTTMKKIVLCSASLETEFKLFSWDKTIWEHHHCLSCAQFAKQNW